jgi:hypothetical protein
LALISTACAAMRVKCRQSEHSESRLHQHTWLGKPHRGDSERLSALSLI